MVEDTASMCLHSNNRTYTILYIFRTYAAPEGRMNLLNALHNKKLCQSL